MGRIQPTLLNRGITIGSMQRALGAAGFDIETWCETLRTADDVGRLRPEIVKKAQEVYPDVQLADFLATDILFVARKPEA